MFEGANDVFLKSRKEFIDCSSMTDQVDKQDIPYLA